MNRAIESHKLKSTNFRTKTRKHFQELDQSVKFLQAFFIAAKIVIERDVGCRL